MPSRSPTHHFLNRLVRHRYMLLLCTVVVGGFAAWTGSQLEMERSIERMFADHDPLLADYRQLQQLFGEHHIVLGVYQDPRLTSESQIQCVVELADAARQIPGVAAVVSLADIPGLLDADGANFKTDDRASRLQQVFAGYTHNEALDAAGIVCLLDRDPGIQDQCITELESLLASYPGGMLVGEPVLVHEAFDMLEADGRRLNTWCLALLLTTILACFRQLRWLVLPLVVVQLALALTRATLVALDLHLSMVSSLLAAIVTVVGVATVVHLIVRYRDERGRGRTPRTAFLRAGHLLVAPVFFACLTDAVGFAALMSSRVKPVVDFGLMMAVGSLMVLVAIVLVAPGIMLFPGDRRATASQQNHHALQHRLRSLYAWSRRHQRLLALTLGVATVAALVGSTRLVQETDFTRNFRQDSQLVKGYRYVDLHFGGAGVWDIVVPVPHELDREFLLDLLDFESDLRLAAPRLTKIFSLADLLDAGTGGIRQLRLGADLAIHGGIRLMRGRMPEFVAAIYHAPPGAQQHWLRIMLRAPERLEAEEKTTLIAQVRQESLTAYPQSTVTGYYVLLTQLIESLLRDQWTTFGVAVVGITITMAVAFRSVPLALATLVPNVLPIVWLFGAMGWLGIRVNMGAAMIAAVSVGLSVDGSIHYVMSYRRLRREGHSLDEALEGVQATVGRAAVFATLALVVGFTTLVTSDFVPTIYFGALVSLSMLGGLGGNLIVLPLLIQRLER